jgi:hypothetical protein
VDLDLHGIVGIRLIRGSAEDVATVTKQVGATPAYLGRKPEILLEFVDGVVGTRDVRSIGVDDAGFGGEEFYVFRGRGKARTATAIRFEQAGLRSHILCESGAGAVPLLVPLMNLAALAKGFLPMHASAFSYNGSGLLATGWTKGGKTETLLGFMANGATYIGDEWVYLSGDGTQMFGLPQPITLWDWHLDDLPQYRTGLGWRRRARLRTNTVLKAAERVAPGRFVASRMTGRVLGLTERQLHVTIRPEALFGASACERAGRLDKIVFLVSHESPEVVVEAADPDEIANRMLFSLRYERLELLSNYFKFRFAFPDASNELIDGLDEVERESLPRALAGKDAYVVYHPFPAPIPALFDAIAPLV